MLLLLEYWFRSSLENAHWPGTPAAQTGHPLVSGSWGALLVAQDHPGWHSRDNTRINQSSGWNSQTSKPVTGVNVNDRSVEGDGWCLSTFTCGQTEVIVFLVLICNLQISGGKYETLHRRFVAAVYPRSPVWSHLRQKDKIMVWVNLFRGNTTPFGTLSVLVCAMAELLACTRGIERDPCLGEWEGLRRGAHADLMCV